MSGRRIIMLYRALPQDSAVMRSYDPSGYLPTRWTTSDHMLALISEQIDLLCSMTYAVNTGKKGKKWKPVKHVRPELPLEYRPKPKRKRSATAEEVRAILRGEL